MFIDIAENCSTVKDFYENINNLKKTFAQNNEQNRRKASIVLSTIHSAKGLEWDEIDRYKDLPVPAITVIPGRAGAKGVGLANIKRAVERAVGADILK